MGAMIYMDDDSDLGVLSDFTIAVVGYGTQGTARALNMRDSGLKVIIGADEDHPEYERAIKDGFEVVDKSEFGPTPIVRKAIVSGELDIYPDKSGNKTLRELIR